MLEYVGLYTWIDSRNPPLRRIQPQLAIKSNEIRYMFFMAQVVPISKQTHKLTGCTTEAWPNVGPQGNKDPENEWKWESWSSWSNKNIKLSIRINNLHWKLKTETTIVRGKLVASNNREPKKTSVYFASQWWCGAFQKKNRHTLLKSNETGEQNRLKQNDWYDWDFPIPSWTLLLQSKETSDVVLMCFEMCWYSPFLDLTSGLP